MDEVKAQISQRTGIPLQLLTAETKKELFAQAKALLELRDDPPPAQTNAERFAELFRQAMDEPEPPKNQYFAALAEIEAGFPVVPDGGEAGGRLPDGRPAREQFADWFKQQTAFDPFRDEDGWKKIN